MTSPLVSVIIPNYNYARYISEAIDGVLGQTYPNIETIVVDDGSKDDSRDIIESYGDRIRAIFQQNQGVSAARNNGTKASSGEFIAFLDADDAWLPEKIEKQVELFLADPEVALVHSGLIEIDKDGNNLSEHTDGMSGQVAREMLLFERPVILGGGSGIMVRRTAFDDIGGFDTRLSTSADWDFGYSIAARYKVGFDPAPTVLYRQHNSNMHSNIRLMEHDTMIAWAKAFSSGDEKLQRVRRTSYGVLHKVLAGSYLQCGQYGGFVRNVAKSIWFKPAYLGYYLKLILSGGRGEKVG